MTIEDFLDAQNIDLIVKRYANQDNRWCTRFDHCEVVDGRMLIGAHDNGPTVQESIADYLAQVRGRQIRYEFGDNKRYFLVPKQVGL